MLNNEFEIEHKAVDTYGEKNQEDMMIEEMSELTKAIIKNRRYSTIATTQNILEEMADVQIMLDQMYILYGRPDRYRDEKLIRLASNLGVTPERNAQ